MVSLLYSASIRLREFVNFRRRCIWVGDVLTVDFTSRLIDSETIDVAGVTML
jgi:hypothetical protein